MKIYVVYVNCYNNNEDTKFFNKHFICSSKEVAEQIYNKLFETGEVYKKDYYGNVRTYIKSDVPVYVIIKEENYYFSAEKCDITNENGTITDKCNKIILNSESSNGYTRSNENVR